MKQNKKDVIIIGAGPAGISASYQLSKENKSVINLEKLELPGGFQEPLNITEPIMILGLIVFLQNLIVYQIYGKKLKPIIF